MLARLDCFRKQNGARCIVHVQASRVSDVSAQSHESPYPVLERLLTFGVFFCLLFPSTDPMFPYPRCWFFESVSTVFGWAYTGQTCANLFRTPSKELCHIRVRACSSLYPSSLIRCLSKLLEALAKPHSHTIVPSPGPGP